MAVVAGFARSSGGGRLPPPLPFGGGGQLRRQQRDGTRAGPIDKLVFYELIRSERSELSRAEPDTEIRSFAGREAPREAPDFGVRLRSGELAS